jgi:hypothetical protein
MPKRAIRAKEILADIRGGMSDTDLMRKHRLTPKGLDSVFRKLLRARVIKRADLMSRTNCFEHTIELDGLEIESLDESTTVSTKRRTSSYSFSGRIEDIDILDYIQFLLTEGGRALLEVTPKDGRPCMLFVDCGEVLHAVNGSLEGEEAFYHCMQFKGGEFAQHPWVEPRQVTVGRPGMSLLVEAARRRDEAEHRVSS